jgi:hypothetical protein
MKELAPWRVPMSAMELVLVAARVIRRRNAGVSHKRTRRMRDATKYRRRDCCIGQRCRRRCANVNEVTSNRCCQLAGKPLGSKTPVHPNNHVNMAQSSNDTFPSAMHIAAAANVKQRLVSAVTALRDAIGAKASSWDDVVKIGRTHMRDATPLTLGQEWSGYAGMLTDDLTRVEAALRTQPGAKVSSGRSAAPSHSLPSRRAA